MAIHRASYRRRAGPRRRWRPAAACSRNGAAARRMPAADRRRRADGWRRARLRSAYPAAADTCRQAISERAARVRRCRPACASRLRLRCPPKLDHAVPAGSPRRRSWSSLTGGGWAIGDKRHSSAPKAAHLPPRAGRSPANYRLVPAVTVESQPPTSPRAIAWLRADADAAQPHRSPSGIVADGPQRRRAPRGAGRADPRYLAAAGVPYRLGRRHRPARRRRPRHRRADGAIRATGSSGMYRSSRSARIRPASARAVADVATRPRPMPPTG